MASKSYSIVTLADSDDCIREIIRLGYKLNEKSRMYVMPDKEFEISIYNEEELSRTSELMRDYNSFFSRNNINYIAHPKTYLQGTYSLAELAVIEAETYVRGLKETINYDPLSEEELIRAKSELEKAKMEKEDIRRKIKLYGGIRGLEIKLREDMIKIKNNLVSNGFRAHLFKETVSSSRIPEGGYKSELHLRTVN